jgi:hypothetical protein
VAAAGWHASLDGDDTAVFAEFNTQRGKRRDKVARAGGPRRQRYAVEHDPHYHHLDK